MRRASITLFLCLVLAVLLTIISTALFSARSAAGRAVFASAAEQGMFSLFSRYDRTLFDDYGILALDGGYGGSKLKLGALQEEAEEVVGYCTGESGELAGPSNLMKLSQVAGEVTGYRLLTDQKGAAFRRQVGRALTGMVMSEVLDSARDKLAVNSTAWEKLKKEGSSVDTEEIEQQYRDIPRVVEAEKTAYAVGEAEAILCVETDQEREATTPVATENPIELILGMQKLGVLNLVLPKGTNLSSATMDSDTVSKRDLQTGMGIMAIEEDTLTDQFALLEYLVDTFPDFTGGKEESGALLYQVEYAIGHKQSDIENLKVVLNRLLAVREVANYLYLLKDAVRQEEVQTASLALCTMLAVPVAQPVVAEMLRLCWAYGESILDLRELLKGGKIALMKDASSWQLSLANLTHLQEEQSDQHSSLKGLDYSWYLRLLLLTEDEDSLTESMMDLMEHQIRHKEGHEGFRLDNCLVSMKLLFRARQDDLFLLEAERSYNYEE